VAINKDKWDKLIKVLEGMGQVNVGVQANAGTNSEGVDLVDIAVTMEFGTEDGTIEPRPFIRGTFEAKRDELATMQIRIAKAVLAGKITADQADQLLGQWGAAAVKSYVKDGASPFVPLKDSTIKAKGSSRPLVDTGQLINSVTYVVDKGES
jgi:hypothetical protein